MIELTLCVHLFQAMAESDDDYGDYDDYGDNANYSDYGDDDHELYGTDSASQSTSSVHDRLGQRQEPPPRSDGY